MPGAQQTVLSQPWLLPLPRPQQPQELLNLLRETDSAEAERSGWLKHPWKTGRAGGGREQVPEGWDFLATLGQTLAKQPGLTGSLPLCRPQLGRTQHRLLVDSSPNCGPDPLPAFWTAELCPRHLDCTLQRRKECPLGSHACGPCLPQFFEDGEGRCVIKTGAPKGQTAVVPNPEEEIDLVSDALAKQGRGPLPHSQEESPAPTGQHSRNGASKAESSQSGRRGWPDTSSHPTTEPVHNPPVESTHISSNDALVLGLIVVCTVAGVAALVVATICWCRLQREIQLAQKADYPANKLPQLPSYDKLSPGDRKLAQSAQMYHYQHQKQQMLSLEKCVPRCGDGFKVLQANKEEAKATESVSSDEENEDGDFTVYECPGLAPTGEMEVKNPLFDDSTLPPKLHP
ncbi:hypothetical protein Chor_001989 [Crotalus horridus]